MYKRKVKVALLYAFRMQPFVIEKLPPPEIDWVPLIPLIGQANRKLAEYEGVLYGSPNSDVLISPLTRREAVLSSKIEGTQATVGEVLKFEAGEAPEQESRREDIYEIMNYRQALREAERELQERPFI
jgi:Fic family protein